MLRGVKPRNNGNEGDVLRERAALFNEPCATGKRVNPVACRDLKVEAILANNICDSRPADSVDCHKRGYMSHTNVHREKEEFDIAQSIKGYYSTTGQLSKGDHDGVLGTTVRFESADGLKIDVDIAAVLLESRDNRDLFFESESDMTTVDNGSLSSDTI